jgi:hypothetical protein
VRDTSGDDAAADTEATVRTGAAATGIATGAESGAFATGPDGAVDADGLAAPSGARVGDGDDISQ